MLKLRQLAPSLCHTQYTALQLFYVRPLASKANTTDAKMSKFVHEEKLKYISSTAFIKVISDIYVKVCSADVHDYPSGDVFIAQLHGGPAKNCHATMDVKVSDDERNVEVIVKKTTKALTDFHCVLAVPIKSSLDLQSQCGATVTKMFGDVLKIKAQKYIGISDAKADIIEVESVDGNIVCNGMLLGRQTKIETKKNGHVILDKVHGDQLSCKANTGNIVTKCCYVESSKFETNSGSLDLQNVHKNTEVHVHRDGNLKMTGVHGNIKVHFNGSSMNLQLSELVGQNYIKVNNAKTSVINISDVIESNTSIEAHLDDTNSDAAIILDITMQHLTLGLQNNKQQFKWPLEKEHSNKLQIAIKDSLTLGKSSWAEMLKLRMDENPNNKTTSKS